MGPFELIEKPDVCQGNVPAAKASAPSSSPESVAGLANRSDCLLCDGSSVVGRVEGEGRGLADVGIVLGGRIREALCTSSLGEKVEGLTINSVSVWLIQSCSSLRGAYKEPCESSEPARDGVSSRFLVETQRRLTLRNIAIRSFYR